MKRLSYALAIIAATGIAAPAFAGETTAASAPMKLAQSDVQVRIGDRDRDRKRIVVRHDRGWHHGWERRHHDTKKVVIKHKRNGTTVVKKKIEG